MTPETLAAVRSFMTDGIDSPLYGGDPLAARRAADALRRRVAGAGRRAARDRRRRLKLLNLLSPSP